MLIVKTQVHASTIAGLGLFAAEPISAGQVWWRFDDRIDRTFTQTEYDQLPSRTKEWLRTYAYLQGGVWVLCGDHGMFVNHSEMPNSVTIGNESIAIRDIAVGEEIVENYREFCEDWPFIPFLAAQPIPASETTPVTTPA
jgi:SET domain-containing protein